MEDRQPTRPTDPVAEIFWTGRFPEAWPGGRDGWNTSRRDLARLLEGCARVVILDAPSFPWLVMSPRVDTPMVLRLPEELDAGVLSQLLGAGALRRLTPYDRLIHGHPGVRDRLSEEWELPDVWLRSDDVLATPAADPAAWLAALHARIAESGPADRLGKSRHNRVLRAALEELKRCVPGSSDDEAEDGAAPRPLIALVAPDRYRSAEFHAGFRDQVFRLDRFEKEADGTGFRLPAPAAAVVLLADGGQDPEVRRHELARTAAQLLPGSALIIVGHVVTEHPDRVNPSIGDLVDDVQQATGGAVQLEELRSLHWPEEPFVRGVVLRFTHLGQGRA
jgi:hypothetical protein